VSTHNIHIFISHSWSYSGHYDTLYSWIFGKSWSFGQASLKFSDYSVPKNDPIHTTGTDKDLENKIFNKIALSHVVVIPTGMYASYSKWIKKELDGAKKKYSKPVLAVNPWGQIRRSSVVQEAASKTVGWNSKSVVNGIWELYYNGKRS